ncbi:MAG: hypothetical protein ABSH07_12885 [Candidatus Dormibacteria bacterium]|jgi:hypothetical protein
MAVGPSLDDLARRNVPIMPGAVPAPSPETSLDRVLRMDDDELAREQVRSTLDLRDLEREARKVSLRAQIAEGNAKLRKTTTIDAATGEITESAPQGGLLSDVFGFFANQNLELQKALAQRSDEASVATREELKSLREMVAQVAQGGGQGPTAFQAQLQMIRDAMKFQADLIAESKALQPEPAVPAGVQRVSDMIAYEDAMTRRDRMHLEMDKERETWKEEVREFNEQMRLSMQRMGFVMQLASRHVPEIVGAITGRITGVPPPPPPPPPDPGVAASQAAAPPGTPPEPPPLTAEQLVLTECPTCHRRFGVAPGSTEAMCAYADCPSNGERLLLSPIDHGPPPAPAFGSAPPVMGTTRDPEEE